MAGNTLVLTKLDRFASSIANAMEKVRMAFKRALKSHGISGRYTYRKNLILTVMSAFAQFNRDMIVECTQEGKDLAKQLEA